jgi:hypothetical protein
VYHKSYTNKINFVFPAIYEFKKAVDLIGYRAIRTSDLEFPAWRRIAGQYGLPRNNRSIYKIGLKIPARFADMKSKI